MSKNVIAVIVVVVVLGALGYLGRHQIKSMLGGGTTPAPAATAAPVVTEQPTESPTTEATSSANTVTISGSEFKFTPATLTAKAGEKVTVVFKNTGNYPHNFTIEGIASTKTIQGGESDSITFTPKAGTYTYFCSVDSHEDKGMKGTLTVE